GLVRGRSGDAMRNTIADFNKLGANPSVGQASGSHAVQGLENLLAGGPTSSGVMNRFAERQAEDIGGGLQGIANSISRNASSVKADEPPSRGIMGDDGFKDQTRAVQRRLYDELDAKIDPQARVGVENAQRTLPEINPAIPGAPALTQMFQNARIQNIE